MSTQKPNEANPNLISWASREVGDQFQTYKFAYGTDAACNVWDRAEALAAARGEKEITPDDWNAAALDAASVAEREAVQAAQRARYQAALAAAGVQRQEGVTLLPNGSIRLSAAWVSIHAARED